MDKTFCTFKVLFTFHCRLASNSSKQEFSHSRTRTRLNGLSNNFLRILDPWPYNGTSCGWVTSSTGISFRPWRGRIRSSPEWTEGVRGGNTLPLLLLWVEDPNDTPVYSFRKPCENPYSRGGFFSLGQLKTTIRRWPFWFFSGPPGCFTLRYLGDLVSVHRVRSLSSPRVSSGSVDRPPRDQPFRFLSVSVGPADTPTLLRPPTRGQRGLIELDRCRNGNVHK